MSQELDLGGHVTARKYKSEAYLKLRQYDSVLYNIRIAITTASQGNDLEEISILHQIASNIHEAMGDPTQALNHYKEYSALKDSALNMQKLDKIETLMAEYDTEKKEESIAQITQMQPDIVFLDIHLGEKTGLQLLQDLGEIDFQLIFVTAHQNYALEAFKFSTIDYLLKPVDAEELTHAVDKAIDSANQQALKTQINALVHNLSQEFKPKKIVLADLEGVHIIDVPDILWCHANGSYTEFQLEDGSKMVVSKHLKTYERLLEKYGFYRIHRSYLVNGSSIVKVDRSQGMVVMKNNHQLPVSISSDMLKLILDRLQG